MTETTIPTSAELRAEMRDELTELRLTLAQVDARDKIMAESGAEWERQRILKWLGDDYLARDLGLCDGDSPEAAIGAVRSAILRKGYA